MKEAYGNIWDMKNDAICITTNGYVKNNGEAVMGRGIAKEAAEEYPLLPKWLGNHLRTNGNHVTIGSFDYPCTTWNGSDVCEQVFFIFPVKPAFGPRGEMGWKAKADLDLIKQSGEELMALINEFSYMKTVLLPRPGCGNGGLSWKDVKPIIEPILDDRVTVVTFHPD